MPTPTYARRTSEIETYFDHTALDAWKRLTSDQPVSGIRATVRKGREAMRGTLSGWLPADLSGWRILDAGCGSGGLSVELAARGADVVGIDLSARTIAHAEERLAAALSSGATKGTVRFHAGDMLADHGRFDAVVSMDALIHYSSADAARAIETLASRTDKALLFTVAPRTALLSAMLAAGKMFPRRDRSPLIYPVAARKLVEGLVASGAMSGWRAGRTQRISSGFYTSQAMEVLKS